MLASLGSASKGAKVEPLNLKTEFENREPEESVYRVVSIPLWGWLPTSRDQHDPRTPYRVGATAWDDYVQSNGINALIFYLQHMFLLVEYADGLGGWDCCDLEPETDPETYYQVCRTQARMLMGTKPHPSTEEIKKKMAHVKMTHRVNLRFLHDVAWEKVVLKHELDKKAMTDKQKAKEKKKQKRLEAAAAKKRKATAEPVVEKTQDQLDAEWFAELGLTYYRFGIVGKKIQKTLVGPSQKQQQQQQQPVEATEEGSSHSGGGGMEAVEVPEGEEEEEEEEQEPEVNELPPKPEFKGPRLAEKVSVTITEIPHKDNSSDIMGLMVNFLIRDQGCDPGFFYSRAMDNLKARSSRGKGKFFGKQNDYPEMFDNYEAHMLSMHPAGKYTTKETYVRCVEQLYPDFVARYYRGSRAAFLLELNPGSNTRAHLYNLLSPEFAIQCLANAGGDPAVLRTADKWIDRESGTFYFPPNVRTWKPQSIHVFWDNPTKIGLVRQYLPHVDMRSDFLRSLCSGVNMRNFLEGASDAAVQVQSKLDKILTENMIVFNEALDKFRSLGYDTSNEFVYKYKQTVEVYHHVDQHYPSHHAAETLSDVQGLQQLYGGQWRRFLTEEQAVRVEEYELYANIINTAQDALNSQFLGIINLERDAENLPVSDALRSMIKWYQNVHASKLPHMTREYATIDPQLDTFGNTMVRQLYIYTHYAKILQPMICLLSEGLFSCYDAFIDELSYHQMIHGRYEIGKTWTGIRTLTKFTCIPGTVSEYSLATKASDTTQKHSYDEIIATDECPEWLVNEAEAKKNPELVNKAKVKMTRGQLVQKTFKFVDLPSGRKVRWVEDITTDHKNACIFISNGTAESKRALSSRMHRLIMKQCDILPNDMKGYVGETQMKDAQMFLHMNQFMSALSKKLAACGGIRPDVEMQLFEDVSSRVISYLRKQNAVPEDVGGTRSLEIIKSYLRQLIYKMAIRYTYDFPWSKHYQKKFHPEQLRDIQPFLYVTTSMIYWVWTSCAAEWVNDDYCNVLQAMQKEADVEWGKDDTPYSLFENDVDGLIKFKTVENRYFNSEKEDQGDRHLVDLNYLVLEGTEDTIAQRLAQHTMPRMEADQIKGVIKRLSEMQKVPTSGGYRPVGKSALEKWHRFNDQGTKNTEGTCPHEFLYKNPNSAVPRTENDMPKLSPGSTLPIVDRSFLTSRKLYFMPGFADHFRQEIILDALNHAMLCSSMRPGKVLLGFTNRENPSRLEVQTLPAATIEKMVHGFDEDDGFYWNAEGEWVNDNPYAVSRKHGITFNRAGALSEMDVIIETAVPLAPKPVGDDSWRAKYQADAQAMSRPQDLVFDLDVESATRQHLKCGRPLDEAVRTPQWIAEQNAAHRITNCNADYPYDEIRQRSRMEKQWGGSVRIMDRTQSRLEALRAEGRLSNAERAAAAAAALAAEQPRAHALSAPAAPKGQTQPQKRTKSAPSAPQAPKEQAPPPSGIQVRRLLSNMTSE